MSVCHLNSNERISQKKKTQSDACVCHDIVNLKCEHIDIKLQAWVGEKRYKWPQLHQNFHFLSLVFTRCLSSFFHDYILLKNEETAAFNTV
jgi:hypothetical protein